MGVLSLALSVVTLLVYTSTASTVASNHWHRIGRRHNYNHNPTQNWLNHGGDLLNRRYAKNETKISPKTASKLRLKWKFYAGKDITATPAIYDDTLYFPSWNGNIYAVKACDGSLVSVVWMQNLGKLTGLNGTGYVFNVTWIVSRSTPTIIPGHDLLIFGLYGPARVLAVTRSTGKLVWSTLLDKRPAGLITMSGTYYKGNIYIGTSSSEEGFSVEECCTFQGSFAKLDARTGSILWQTFMLPDNFGQLGQYSGAAVWGSSPSIDVRRRHVYIATGNLYSVPENVSQCQENQNNNVTTVPSQPDACIDPNAHANSILALNLDTGKIQWYRQLGGYDVWFLECLLDPSTCPTGPNLDVDFGEAPMMLSPYVNGTKRDVVVAVQKSGFAWALDRNNGSLVWSTEAGPGGAGGGGTWGAATDKKRVYTNIANSAHINFTLRPSNRTTNSGGWVAMDSRNGKILWSTADPGNATASGPVSVANGVLFAGSTNPRGPIYAMNAKSGEILWSYETGATVYGGMSISNGCIYVGNGYAVNVGIFMPFTAGKLMLAFCVVY